MALALASKSPSRKPASVMWAARQKPARATLGPHARSARGALVSGPVLGASSSAPAILTKLEVGAPNDEFEQEAERVADQVMRIPASATVAASSPAAGAQRFVQRMCDECAEEESAPLQRMPLPAAPAPLRISALEESLAAPSQATLLQRQDTEEDEILHARPAAGTVPAMTWGMETEVQALRGRGQPLSAAERAFFEPRFGHDFSQVRIHADGRAAASARVLNARAYAIGQDVVFAAGHYAPKTAAGRRLLAHELTHVVQQHSANGPTLVQRAPTYKTCDGKTELIGAGIEKAKPLAGAAKGILEDMFPTAPQRDAIRDAFGDGIDKTFVAGVYGKIEQTLDSKTYECKTSCPKTPDERETCARGELPGTLITICPRFELPTCGAPELTLIHEAAHNEGIHHGEAGAADNAHNYEKFAAELRS